MKYTVNEYETKKGAKGLIISVPEVPVVSYNFRFRAGYRNGLDYEHKSQVAHVLEHMAASATAKYPGVIEFETVLKKNGAYTNAYTAPSFMGYVARCADFEWQRILELMKEQFCHPYFGEKLFQGEMGNIRSELTANLSRAGRMLGSAVAKQMGFDVKTYPEYIDSLDNITLDDVRAHWRHTHTAKNLRFVIAGDFENKGKLAELKASLEDIDLPEGERLPRVHDTNIHSAPALVMKRQDTPAIDFTICMETIREYSEAEEDAMDALNHILTGTMASRILGKARTKGLLYGCTMGLSDNYDNAEWYLDGRANADKLPEFFDLAVHELQRVKDGDISEQELDDAKSYALGKFHMGLQTAGQLANFLAGRYFYDGTIKKYEDGPAQINAVTIDEMVRLAREFFTTNIWSMGLWGSTDQAMADKLQGKFAELFK